MQKNKEIDKFYRAYNAFLAASKYHNVEVCAASVKYLEEQEDTFWQNVLGFISDARGEIDSIKGLYSDPEAYLAQLFSSLLAKNLPVEQKEGIITLGPIVIEPRLADFQIIIGIGRKKQKLSELEISRVTRFIEQFYKKINSSFNAGQFVNRLIKAYEYLNKSIYASRLVQYGNAVPLDDIFKVFTVSPASSDYKIENFLWDLGRLISSGFIHPGFQLEFGFSRHEGRMLIIRDADGKDYKYSTLTLYKKEV